MSLTHRSNSFDGIVPANEQRPLDFEPFNNPQVRNTQHMFTH